MRVSLVEPGAVDTELATAPAARGAGGDAERFADMERLECRRHRRRHRVHRHPPAPGRGQRDADPPHRADRLTESVQRKRRDFGNDRGGFGEPTIEHEDLRAIRVGRSYGKRPSASWIASPARNRWTPTSRTAASRTSGRSRPPPRPPQMRTGRLRDPIASHRPARHHHLPKLTLSMLPPKRRDLDLGQCRQDIGAGRVRTSGDDASFTKSFTTADTSAKTVTRRVQAIRAGRHRCLRQVAQRHAHVLQGPVGGPTSEEGVPATRPRQVALVCVTLRRPRSSGWWQRRRSGTGSR